MDQEQRAKVRGVLQRHGVALAYLFGSQARENAGPLSDVDIAVVFVEGARGSADDLKRFSALRSDLQKIFSREVDLVDTGAAHSPLLRHRVVFRGQLLYGADQVRRQQFERRVLHEYEDTRYLRSFQSNIMHRQILKGEHTGGGGVCIV